MDKGKLFVVATPIGNLGDIAFRAIETLKQCSIIACEDRRVSANLLKKFTIEAKLIPYHEQNELFQVTFLLGQLLEGKNIAVICDAGTPTISDPGFRIVRECKKNDIDVIPIPGPNAAITALSASGLPTNRFLFLGFPGHKESERVKILEQYKHFEATLIFYESCYRVEKFLNNIFNIYGPDRIVSVSKELTKIHETILTASVVEILKRIKNLTIKGEFVVLIASQNYIL
ncbi:MAG: 16S rRNA (cytidine(1402)-2'-O)-methyltransferase [Puniceicoccales bacterium]|jgi:16S rRNA (cytidine1402-2'-O)-methyltransferase|nr:16S rRNA (cytidine(1402)-2'-O)-methyltransferase [Puniceicoccales bacterium]